MPPRMSAGLLMYRIKDGLLEVFLAHPGGPLYRTKDRGYWTIPKGEPPENEPLLETAVREFKEETGITPHGPFLELGSIRQKGGKIVHAWAFDSGENPVRFTHSNTFEMEWPPKSGRIQSFQEVDRAQFFSLTEGREKLKDAQWPLVERLVTSLEKI